MPRSGARDGAAEVQATPFGDHISRSDAAKRSQGRLAQRRILSGGTKGIGRADCPSPRAFGSFSAIP